VATGSGSGPGSGKRPSSASRRKPAAPKNAAVADPARFTARGEAEEAEETFSDALAVLANTVATETVAEEWREFALERAEAAAVKSAIPKKSDHPSAANARGASAAARALSFEGVEATASARNASHAERFVRARTFVDSSDLLRAMGVAGFKGKKSLAPRKTVGGSAKTPPSGFPGEPPTRRDPPRRSVMSLLGFGD
jgi:hypothetical protein